PYRLLLQEMNEGAATVMPDGTVLYCNKRFAAMLGVPLEKVIGYRLKDFIEPASGALLEGLLRSGKYTRVKEEIAFATPGGPTPVYCSIGPVSLDGVQCLSFVATDLTEQKRSEEIVASEKLIRQILDSAADVIIVCDEQGNITHASRVGYELAGTSAVLRHRFEEVFPLTFKNGEPVTCSVGQERSLVGSCLNGRTVQALEVEFVRSDGKKFDLLMSAGPLRDRRDLSRGCVFTLTDITRLKVAEEELRESQAQLADELSDTKLLQGISAALIEEESAENLYEKILAAAVTVMHSDFASMQMLFPERGVGGELRLLAFRGFSPEAARFWEWVSAGDDSSCAAALRCGRRVIVRDVETRDVIRTDAAIAEYREVGIRSIQSTPLFSRGGNVVGMISTHWRKPHEPSERDLRLLDILARQAADLIERKRSEEALRESEEKLRRQAEELEQQLIASGRLVSLGEITASMAHEFNNPLGIAMGFAEDLLSEKKPEDADYQPLKIIHGETKRCQKIIQDLLEYARPRPVEKRASDAGELIEKSFKLMANHLHKHRIESALNIEANLPFIEGDPQQIQQVLVNLYLNAIEAMPDGGRLVVSARRKSNATLEISVTDTGIGIAPDELGKIFQPFFSAKKKSGLGLGLPICRRIVANHGGTIEVESRPGQGTTFRICLPVKEMPAEESDERAVG
ncbi:MAG TPA: ATP-binding protein, partial [Verrucomicrobiae bacterium]|nr:ATP-binding protein [Verrucomicrobiae bacterium]